MARPLPRCGSTLLALAGILVFGACDGDDGEGLCERLCTVGDGCGWMRDARGSSPAPSAPDYFRTGPDPSDESSDPGSGNARFACIDSCLEDYRESTCYRARAPVLLHCVERDGCQDDRCRDEGMALADCFERSTGGGPKSPAPPAEDEEYGG